MESNANHKPAQPLGLASTEGLGLAASAPKPRAWTLQSELDAGTTTCSAHLWFTDPVNSAWAPLYDRAALDAERGRVLAAVEQRLLNWRQRTMNKSGDRLALDDFMNAETIADLVDHVCDEWA